MEKNQLHKILSSPFDKDKWPEVLHTVFGATHLFIQPKEILPSNDKATVAFELGNFTTSDDRIIGFYRIVLKSDVKLERNKAGLHALLRNVYKYDVDGAIIVFDQGEKWRLSFVSEIKVLNDEGEVVEQATEPKRYTYLLGKDEKVKTPTERISELIGKKLALKNILDAFSVEALNEEFYKIIAKYFYQLIGGKIGKDKKQKDYADGILQLPSLRKEDRQVYQEFAVRLIGRSVFCWFLKMKKEANQKSLVPENLLSSKAVKNNANYYHTILERLFFQTLNTPMDKRVAHLPDGCEQIPFLNGGLFEPGENDYYMPEKITGLSKNVNTLKIEDQWFLNFFQELEKYNFTIDENSITDVEVSVDPEMLGRIFENLLAEIDPDSGETARKTTGSFYTPREIVDYMATESLVQYLHNKTAMTPEKLRPVFKITAQKQVTFSNSEEEKILDALDKIKILDPACGSGAFPMGVLQKIVIVLQNLDPKAIKWKNRQVNRIKNPIVKEVLRKKLDTSSVEYAQKIGIIQNSLYGVDIQPIAAEISKLRCFLTLIVDENIDDTKANRGIEPLPNLEFKFITADTLLKLPKETDLEILFNADDEVAKLKELREEYLQSFGAEKGEIKSNFTEIRKKIVNKFEASGINSKDYKLSAWDPFSYKKADWFDSQWMFGVDSFDVVIGNPPYIQMQKDNGTLANRYKVEGYVAYERTGDIYALFYESGIKMLSEDGNLTFITSNKWMRAKYGKSLRGLMVAHNPVRLIDLGSGIFSSATVDTNILIVEKKENKKHLKALNLSKKAPLNNLTEEHFLKLKNVTADTWTILNPQEQNIKTKIEKVGTPLKDWDININYGIKTGYNEAFIIDGKTKDELLAQDPKSAEIIKPILRGKDIKRYQAKFADLWLIATFPALKINIDEFPAIKEYLERHLPKIKQTGEIYIDENNIKQKTRKKTGNKWFEASDTIAYYKEFEKEKIVYPETTLDANFFYDDNSFYIEKTGFILIGKYLKYISSLLNSKLLLYAYKKFFTSVTLGNKGFQYNKHALIKFPLPQIPKASQQPFIDLVDIILSLKKTDPASDTSGLEKEIDTLVYGLYGLTEGEILVVEKG